MNAKRPIAFVIAGAWNTAFCYLVFAGVYLALRAFPIADAIRYSAAVVVANAVSLVQGYLVYKMLVFRTEGRYVREFARYVTSYSFLIALNLLVLPVLVELSGRGALVAQAVFVVASAVLSYVLHGKFTFRQSASPRP